MADNNIHTRAKERARIRSVIAANEAANARVSTAAIQPPIATASSTAQSSTPAEPTTVAQPSPSNKSKTPSNTPVPKTSSKSAGKRRLVYNPDIDSDTEECINVLPRSDPPTRTQKVSKRDTKKAARSTLGPTDVEAQALARTHTTQSGITNSEHAVSDLRSTGHNFRPTPPSSDTTNVEHQAPTQTTTVPLFKTPPAPENDAPINITSLALEDRPTPPLESLPSPSQLLKNPQNNAGSAQLIQMYPLKFLSTRKVFVSTVTPFHASRDI
jgi:hypothetical protein